MAFKFSVLCIILCLLKLSSQRQQTFKCTDYIREMTNFHRSGISFKSGPHYVCRLGNVYQVSEAVEIVEEISSGGFNGTIASNSSDVGALIFDNSSLMRIPSEIFRKLPNLMVLSASDIQLRLITRDDFIDAHNLTSLKLSNNLISELEDGTFTNLKKLQKLDLSRNMITTINEAAFVGCGENLYEVNLSFNKIRELDFAALTPLAHPKKLSVELNLESNEIKEVKESHRVSHLVFQDLNLKDNFLHSFSCPDIRISELHLDNNVLDSISFDNCSVEFMKVSNNKLKWLHIHGDLKGLIAQSNFIESFIVNGESQMYHLELTENGETEKVFQSLMLMDQLQYLNLSNSVVGVLHEDTFARMTQLKYLFLKNSGIQIIPFGIFVNNKHLMGLDLSDNDLVTIDLHMFTGLDSLKTLNLSGNKLSQIEGFEKIKTVLPELKEIKLTRNSWKCIYLSTMIRTFNLQGISVSEYQGTTPSGQNGNRISGIDCY